MSILQHKEWLYRKELTLFRKHILCQNIFKNIKFQDMKNVIFLVLMGVIATSVSASAQNKVNQKKESKKLMEVNRQWAAAATPEQFFSFISSDALLMAPDKPVIQGHEGIGGVLAEFQSLPGFEIKWEPQEAFVAKSGDLGYTVDRILVTFDGEKGEKVKLFEKGVTVWKKDSEGNWKLAVDIWNVDPTINSIYN